MLNLLQTRRGRLTTLFLLYLTEGIPLGFTATAVATEMKRMGLGPAAIGGFIGSLYLPWAFKWAIGPLVDVLSPDRFGRRRAWILGAQLMMVVTLLLASEVDAVHSLGMFTAIIMLHNVFGATQDVAIDALACHVLPAEERGLANGLMFGAAYLGQTIGGSGVLFLRESLVETFGPAVAWRAGFGLVGAAILSITLGVVLNLKEPQYPPRAPVQGSPLGHVLREIGKFLMDTWRAFTGTRAAKFGVLYALLPAGSMALSLALQSNLCVELGLNDTDIATMNLWTTVLSAGCCIAGGLISDKFGRRRMLALYLALTALPTAYLAFRMHQFGWVMPVAANMAHRPVVPPELVTALWVATLSFAVPQGLMYGTRTALFMDITTPAVAATQFTAYMALLNLTISYSAKWQGKAAEAFGYPTTLAADAALAFVALPLLFFMAKPKEQVPASG